MRTLEPDALTALQSGALAMAMMVTMEFTGGTLRVNTSRYELEDLESPPNTFIGVGLVGKIEQIEDKVQEISGIQYTLSGVDVSLVAIALGEQVRGRPVKFELALFDAETHDVLDISQIWAGTMSTMGIRIDSGLATIVITCEHRGVIFSRPRPLRYTDNDQQKLFPGDRCLEFIVSQSQTQDVWPAASFDRQ